MGNIEFAGFWRRFSAFLLDVFIFGLPVQLVFFFVTGRFSNQSTWLSVANYIIIILYQVLFLSSSWQATLGKRLMSVYVVSAADKGRIEMGKAFLRYLVFSVASLLLILIPLLTGAPDSQPPIYAPEEQQRTKDITYKKLRGLPISMEDEQFQIRMKRKGAVSLAHLSPEEEQRFMDITDKEANHTPLTDEESNFEHDVLNRNSEAARKNTLWFLPVGIYYFVIVLMIGLMEQKTGPHDLIAGTRVLRGRPEKNLPQS